MSRKFTKDSYCAYDFLCAAFDHLASARILFDDNPQCYDSAGYLAHLGFELIFKALLLHKSGSFDACHSLKAIRQTMKSAEIGLPFTAAHERVLDRLDHWKELRYPAKKANGSPSIGNRDWDRVEALYGWIDDRIPPELRRQMQWRDRRSKSGRVLVRRRKDHP
jgi:HEPN domain-containing protein